jgi:hypothetical protein
MRLETIFTETEYDKAYRFVKEKGYSITEIEPTEKDIVEIETYFEDEDVETVVQEAIYDNEGNIISEEIKEKQTFPTEKTREVIKTVKVRQFKIIEIAKPSDEDIKQAKIAELKAKLSETDYVVIKIAEGEATQEEYAKVLANRKAWRVEINDLED